MSRICKKNLILGTAGVLLLGSPQLCRAAVTYDVLLPSFYEEDADRHYPTVYLLTEGDDDKAVPEAMRETDESVEAMDTILVKADLGECAPEDLWEQMRGLVEEIDAHVPDGAGALGTGGSWSRRRRISRLTAHIHRRKRQYAE